MSLHLPLLLLYSAVLVALGLTLGTRVRATADFFVAGRRLSPGLLFSTMLAANIGAGSTVGAAGLGYRDGFSAWWWVGSAGLGSAALALWVGPKLWRIAQRHDLRTVGDYLEHRYGRAVRATIAVLLWCGTLAILAGQLLAIAWVLNLVTGLPRWAGCLAGGVVMTVYFAAGGLRAAAWVNLVQLAVLLLGFGIALPMALQSVGGWAQVGAATSDIEGYWSPWRGGLGSGWLYLPMLAPAFIVSPGLLQKIYGARDVRTVRWGVGLNAAALLLFAAVPPLLGAIARSAYPELPNPDLALPTLLTGAVPPLVGSLGLAALLSAEVSSADAILFMLATSLSRDLYQRFIAPSASDAQVLRVARGAALVGGLLGVAIAMVAGSIVDVLSLFYTVLTVSLFVPLVGGLYVRRIGTPEALSSIAAGVVGFGAIELSTAGEGLAGLTPALLGLLVAIGAGVIVSAGRARRVVTAESTG